VSELILTDEVEKKKKKKKEEEKEKKKRANHPPRQNAQRQAHAHRLKLRSQA
jgi:hypothetical protein